MPLITLKLIGVDNYVCLFLKYPHNLDECLVLLFRYFVLLLKNNIHPDYVAVSEKGIRNYQQRLFLE